MFATLKDVSGRVRFRLVATDYATDCRGVLLIGLKGPQQAVRAAWANLVKFRPGTYVQTTELVIHHDNRDEQVRVDPEKRFSSAWVSKDTLLIVREELRKENASIILGGDEKTPSAWFGVALRNIPELPYRDAWLPAMWQAALWDKLIEPMPGSTCPMWKLNYGYKPHWFSMIERLIRQGVVR